MFLLKVVMKRKSHYRKFNNYDVNHAYVIMIFDANVTNSN